MLFETVSVYWLAGLIAATTMLRVGSLQSPYKTLSKIRQAARQKFRAWGFLLWGPDYIQDAYKESKGKPFTIVAPDVKYHFVPSSKYLKEVNNAGDDELSLHAASKQMFMPGYTMAGFNWHDERGKEGIGFVRALRGISTVHLPPLIPTLMTIIQHDLAAEIDDHPVVNGVHHSPVYHMVQHIVARLNSLVFFGAESSHDPEFLEAAVEYIENVIKTAEVLRLLPNFMVPLVGSIMAARDKTQDKVFGVLYTVVEQRLEAKAKENPLRPDPHRPNDCIQWIIDTSPKKKPWTTTRIVHEVMAMWFGALHALSMSLTFNLFDLCTHPEYMQPLREELESGQYTNFLQTAQGLPLLDSFIKESARLTPFETVSVRRRALKDFHLSDGTHVEKGDWTLTPLHALNHDESLYPEALQFDGFRFAKMPKPADRPGANDFLEPTDTWQFWGSGKMTWMDAYSYTRASLSPGRFYSVTAMKLVLAHIILNYDIELVNKNAPRLWVWRTTQTPREDAKMIFNPRPNGAIEA